METNADIIDFFETLVSDSSDVDSEYILLNQADAIIRRLRPWEILKKLDSSKTRVDGEDFSSTKTLPADFDRPNKVFVGTLQRPPLKRVRFEDQQMYLHTAGLYLLDYKNQTLAISSATWTGTIYNHYLYKPDKLIATNTPVFPDDFWPIYAYAMAEIQMGGIDEDDRSVAAVPMWTRTQQKLWDAMISWDADLKDEGDVYRTEGNGDLPPYDLGLLPHNL